MITAHAEPRSAVPYLVDESHIIRALGEVIDPELDEPITDLGFVRSIALSTDEDGAHVEIHLRLPTSFCSPNFAYLMASDSKDAVSAVFGIASVIVELDDHHDSAIINAGLALDAGYRGTFRHEAEDSLDELRRTFQKKAHTAAMERCLTELLRADKSLEEAAVGTVQLADLVPGKHTDALVRRRTILGLSNRPNAIVLVDDQGLTYPRDAVPLALRRARATRISIEGNSHFCRGLLRTRYDGVDADLTSPVQERDQRPLIPIIAKESHQ
ncbi:MAG: metal-sulfur cluster assembly factor [Actinomycetales bacterium]